MLGIHTATLIHMLAAALGLSVLVLSSALAFSIVKYAGAAYLIWLGFRKLFGPAEAVGPTESCRATAMRGCSATASS